LFTYWSGYEVDGSSTTYNIVVPERRLVEEIIRYFLSLKVIDRSADIELTYSEGSSKSSILSRNTGNFVNDNYKHEDIDKLCTILERPGLKTFFISTTSIHPDMMYHEVRKELYNLSKTRPGAEDRVYNYTDLTVSTLYYGAELGVSMEVSFSEEESLVEGYEAEGLIFNKEELINNMSSPHFTLGFSCGPGFIYEYAAYIVSKIAERFPEIGIDGGIDCAGGFVDGCTYSCSLYAYEKITLATTNIADAINNIINDMDIKLQKRSGKYGYDIVPCRGLFLFNIYNVDKADESHLSAAMKIIKGILGAKKELTPEEYETFVRKVAEVDVIDSIDFIHHCTCCFKVEESICALTCVKEKGRVLLQLRVVPELREEFVKRLKKLGYECWLNI
jgi:hypothetical protein